MCIFAGCQFQSTLPLRGATPVLAGCPVYRGISIHAPLTGSDINATPLAKSPINFNPRSPYGERPGRVLHLTKCLGISIHAPLTGSDNWTAWPEMPTRYFNPRSPYGERLSGKISVSTAFQFQSTLPLRGATRHSQPRYNIHQISIHAPLTGSDLFFLPTG